jgi:von Willebrand factor type A domain
VALAVILPLIAFFRIERRSAYVRSLLRLPAPGGSPRLTVAALVAVAVLVGIGAAQPVFEEWDERPERIDAQVFFALDTSRSMLASAGPGRPTRFARAAAAAQRMRQALGDVPVGLASLTDRVLPHLFPSGNRQSFDAVLRHSIAVDYPASDEANNRRATDLGATKTLADGNFFRGTQRRVLVIFTDAETNPIKEGDLTAAFRDSRISTIVVRFWGQRERVYGPEGVEEEYVADADSAGNAGRYAALVKGEAFHESQLLAAIESVRSKLGSGTSVTNVKTADIHPLGPYVLLLALVPLSFLLVRRNLT